MESCEISCQKQIGEIVLCGCLHIVIFDSSDFIRPTEEQIKNLHDMLCIDVKLFEEPMEVL